MPGKPNNRFIIAERRSRVLVLLAQGHNECEIASDLKVGHSTVCRDIKALNQESRDEIKKFETDYYPLEFLSIVNSVRQVLKKAWEIINDETSKWTNKDKINAMKLVVDASRTKLDILIRGPVNLTINDLRGRIEKLNQEEDTPRSYFLPGLEPSQNEDLR